MKSVKIRNLVLGEGRPKICVPVVKTNNEDILNDIRDIYMSNKCDIIEFRADFYEHLNNDKKLYNLLMGIRDAARDLPVLFTIRTSREGGQADIDFEEYSRILTYVAKLKLVDAIDVECFMDGNISSLIEIIHSKNICVIGSNHDFDKTPSPQEMKEKLIAISKAGADIPKLAVMPRNKHDVINLLMTTYEVSSILEKPIITMSMDKIGVISRLSGELFGSALTFGTNGVASAPGQIDASSLRTILDICSIDKC